MAKGNWPSKRYIGALFAIYFGVAISALIAALCVAYAIAYPLAAAATLGAFAIGLGTGIVFATLPGTKTMPSEFVGAIARLVSHHGI